MSALTTKAPAFVVVFEAEEPVRVVSPGPDADGERAFAWILSNESRAMAFKAACEAALKAIPPAPPNRQKG